ncbi:hypothetical protein SMICM304S_06424 [Streptomyces microflavus]
MSTAWTSARMVARWAVSSRWYWAKTQLEMYIGSRTKSAESGPYELRQSTAIISPASACTRWGPRARGSRVRQERSTGCPSAAARMRQSRAVSTREKVTAAAPTGSRAYGRSGVAAPPRVAGPPSSVWVQEAAQQARASWAARQVLRAAKGGRSTRPASDATAATSAAAGGGSRKAAAGSRGRNDPAPVRTEPGSKRRPTASQARQRAASRAAVRQGTVASGRRAGRAQQAAQTTAARMQTRAAAGVPLTPALAPRWSLEAPR